MGKISELPVTTTTTSNDSIIVSNSTSGTRRITPGDLYNSMKIAENIVPVEITDANAATANNVLYVTSTPSTNTPIITNPLNIIVIGDSSSFMQIAWRRDGANCRGSIYRRNCKDGVFGYWFPIGTKYINPNSASEFSFNLSWISDNKNSFTKGIVYGATMSMAFMFIVNIGVVHDLSEVPSVVVYKVYSSDDTLTLTGSFGNGNLTLSFNKTIAAGIVFDIEPLL